MKVFYGLCYFIAGAVLLLSASAGYVASAETDAADPPGEQRTEILIEEATPKKSKDRLLEETTNETDAEKFFRKWAPYLVLTGVGFWGLFAGLFLAYHSLPGGFIVRIVEDHFAGMILVPLSVMIALCIVFLLRWTAGTLEFEIFAFKFQGASGPITLWVLCFFAIVVSIKLLWPLESSPVKTNADLESPPNKANATDAEKRRG